MNQNLQSMKITTQPELDGFAVKTKYGRFAGYGMQYGNDVDSLRQITRREALFDLMRNATEKGANGLVDVHFEIVNYDEKNRLVEVYAFGTGVFVEDSRKPVRQRLSAHARINTRRINPEHLTTSEINLRDLLN
ncbi:MAG: heavy metal-binding domain-containing protein [Aggregatilineales bacterium]